MRILLLIIQLCTLIFATNLSATKLIVSTDIGFDPIDNTGILQFAFQETIEDTIVVDNVGMDWNIGPIRVERNNVTIIFEDGVVVRALPGEFDIFESLIRLEDVSNISMVGYGASLIMNKQEYIDLADSEFRHGLTLNSVTNVVIEGLTVLDSGGDGILLTRSFQPDSQKNFCENVLVKNCRFSNNYRQGMSVTSAKDLIVLNCEFSDTNGTLPEDGIDFEPDISEERLENILVKDCRILNNFGNAIQLALFMMDDSSIDISISIENTYMSNNHDPSNTFDFAEISATDNDDNGVDGFVNFKNCFIESSEWSALYVSKTVESYDLNFEGCVFKDVSNNPIQFNNPIFIEVTDYDNQVPRFGGLNFTDCVIIYDENIPFFDLFENTPTSDGLGDVTGNFYIINPNDAGFNTGINPEGVDITYQHLPSISQSELSLSVSKFDFLEDDGKIEFQVSNSDVQPYPIAATIDYGGDATYGLDYERGSGFVIFDPGAIEVMDTLSIIEDSVEEETESLTIMGIDDDCVRFTQDRILELSISDMVNGCTFDIELFELDILLQPNRASNELRISGELERYIIEIIDADNEVHETITSTGISHIINLSSLPPGSFFLNIENLENDALYFNAIIKE